MRDRALPTGRERRSGAARRRAWRLSGRDLLLLGGGHAHLGVLRALAMRPAPQGCIVTLVADELEVTYSGMLPGLVAELYQPEAGVVDLLPLCTAAGVRLIHDRATRLDASARRVVCARHPALRYDVLSLDIGSAPRPLPRNAGALLLPVRPIGSFATRLDAALRRCRGPPRRLRPPPTRSP